MFLELIYSFSDEKFCGLKMSGDILMLVCTTFIHVKCHQVNCGSVWSGDGKELHPSDIPENSISSDEADLL